MQELGIRLSEWVKEGSRLADKNIEMHGAITGNLHPRVRQELAKMQEFSEIEENSDGLALGRLVTKLLSVASTKHPNIAKSEADNYYYQILKHAKGEDVHYYKTNFDEALMRRKAAGLGDISQADQARHFIDKQSSIWTGTEKQLQIYIMILHVTILYFRSRWKQPTNGHTRR